MPPIEKEQTCICFIEKRPETCSVDTSKLEDYDRDSLLAMKYISAESTRLYKKTMKNNQIISVAKALERIWENPYANIEYAEAIVSEAVALLRVVSEENVAIGKSDAWLDVMTPEQEKSILDAVIYNRG